MWFCRHITRLSHTHKTSKHLSKKKKAHPQPTGGDFLGPSEAFSAHDATGDAPAALSKVFEKTLPLADLFENSMTKACSLDSLEQHAAEKAALAGLKQHLIGVSAGILNKTAT